MSLDHKLLEEELKNKVAADWFAAFDATRIIGKVDFCVAVRATELGLYESENALWAAMKRLSARIEPKVYEYGFLKI